uniref:hypothetical protein n=1 Tax=Gelidibacter sp. TaxID=2018083 RepID=UPI00404A55F1
MKTSFFMLLIFVMYNANAQDSIRVSSVETIKTHAQIFSLSPISKKVDKVNGFVVGFGHINNKNIANQNINGLNIEANPAPAVGALLAFMSVMYLPEIIERNKVSDSIKRTEDYYKINNLTSTPHLRLNGINISTGCFFTTTSMNGLNISIANKFNNFNGLSITVLGTITDNQNGFSIGVVNANNTMKGSTIGIYNQSYDLKGLHVGIFNQTRNNHGLQFGVFNKSNSKGFQIGVWNVNNKRSLPFINW